MARNFTLFQGLAGVLVLLIISLTGCTTKSTTDGTTDVISSTSGKSWWTEDGLVKNGEHARAFVAFNFTNLLQDMAKGEGEYLAAFGNVLGVPFDQQARFQHLVQANYSKLATFDRNLRGGEDLNSFIREVQQTWDLSRVKSL